MGFHALCALLPVCLLLTFTSQVDAAPLLVTALVARLLGACLRSRPEVIWSSSLGWAVSLLGTWLATNAWGAFSPMGYALALAAAAIVVDRVWRPAALAQVVDLLLVVASASLPLRKRLVRTGLRSTLRRSRVSSFVSPLPLTCKG